MFREFVYCRLQTLLGRHRRPERLVVQFGLRGGRFLFLGRDGRVLFVNLLVGVEELGVLGLLGEGFFLQLR